MVATGVARAGFSANVGEADASRNVIVICSKGASVGAVLLEFAAGGRGGQVSRADLRPSLIRPGVPGVRGSLACADATGVPAEAFMAPLVLCASVPDPGGAVADRGARIVTVMVMYE